tara:strand:+ start:5307 stop:7187 length:1881 start_codon:yes stop_codon:yes gene_type:complete
MNKIIKDLVKILISFNRNTKTVIIILCDYCLLIIAFWSSLSLRVNALFLPTIESFYLILFAPLIAIPIFYLCGLYKSLIRYSNFSSVIVIFIAVTIYTFLWFLVVISLQIVVKPYDFLFINWLLSIVFIGGVRYLARYFFLPNSTSYINALIYGAGSSGMQLHAAMKYNLKLKIVGFIDDNKNIHNRYIEGKKVYPKSEVPELIEKKGISEILVALPSAKESIRVEIIRSLSKLPVIIRTMPDISDLAEGKVSVTDLKKINIEDLLRRPKRPPDETLIKKNIEGKNVLITGAGGSIGSEIARQVIKQRPKSVVLYEISEYSLYSVDMELTAYSNEIEIISLLGDVEDTEFLDKVIKDNDIHTIYHTAAYKHVPLIEHNIISAVKCNILGTLSCLNAAIQNNVNSFVYISTDKAVRPTSIMGATKRFAEILIQGRVNDELSKETESSIKVSIVRFGNVLGSSGSVVPLFRDQIRIGGPVTVTDPEIIRYFMTIKEASELVIQAGALGKNAEIFILDMGEQVNVTDLAKDMIRLSGKSVRDKNNPEGDIEIIFTGLRPGEKLYEELLINKESIPTKHEKIMIIDENFLEWRKVQDYLKIISTAINTHDIEIIHSIFHETVEGFQHKLN